jgi:N-acetylglutamate synthase-like GNAT family acetyltransferase
MRWTVRAGEWGDAPALVRMIDLFAQGHPAASVERSPDEIAPYFFGDKRVGNMLVADLAGELIGFCTWRKDFDPFWCKECGEITSVFVQPDHRGVGVAATLITVAFADIRKAGGEYAYGYPSEQPGGFFQRVAISYPSQWCHVSDRAFHRLADLAGAEPRVLARKLPDPNWNKA